MTNTKAAPTFPLPPGVVEATEWCDLNHPADAFRSFTGQRRGVPGKLVGNSPDGPHYVESAGSQDACGSLFDLAVHAQIDIWNMNRHEDYDTLLTAAEARSRAVELRADAAKLMCLAEAFEAAAAEVDQWDWWAPNER